MFQCNFNNYKYDIMIIFCSRDKKKCKLQNSKELLFQVIGYMSIRIHFCEDSNHSNQGYIRTGESEPQFMTEDWP